MAGRPSKAMIEQEEQGLLRRQLQFRVAADRLAAAFAKSEDVQAVALIGSVARPLRREVPRFAPYKQRGVAIAHECKDVDLAAWVSRVDRLDELRRVRVRVVNQIIAEQGHGPAVQEIEVFLLQPETNRYLGRLCYFRACPAGKRDCQAAGCGRQKFLKQHDDFSFWPQAIAEGNALRLYDRRAGGMMARAAGLPMVILDDET